MGFLGKIKEIATKPFYLEEDPFTIIKTVAVISLFVTFFLYHFEPGDMSEVKSNKFLVCMGFGFMSFFACLFYELFFGRVLGIKGKAEDYKFWKWILHMMGIILMISLFNFIYIRFTFFGNIKWELFPYMVSGTLSVGIFPVVAIGAWSVVRQERKYQKIAKEINDKHLIQDELKSNSSIEVLGIPISQIKYVEAMQNYVKLVYTNANGELKESLERDTLKRIVELTKESQIIKCHRSYLVNKEAINSMSGNAQGLVLSLANCPKEIPVSRKFVSKFRS